MEQLVEVIQQLSLARDLPAVMDIVRHAARKLTGADGATFVLRDDGKCFYAEEDAISPLWKGQRFPMSACISGWVMLNKQPAVIEDIYADPRIPADAYRPTFVHSLAMVPIRTIDPVGAIGNYWASRHQPTPEQVKVLQALADTTAVAMENVRVYEELEQRVRHRTSELQSILDNVQVGIVFALDGKIVRTNPKAAGIFRFAAQDALLATSLPALLQPVSDANLVEDAQAQFRKGEVFITETEILRQDGSPCWFRLVAKTLGSDDAPGSEIWVITDIGERKEKERKLYELKIAAETANLAKDSFLATMSHEIRTPLTGMLGMLELLSLTALDDEQRSTLDAAWDSGRGLLRIVSDILDWSKIEAGKMEISPQPTSVQQVLQDVVNTYSRIASSNSLLLWQHADARLGEAYIVDPLRLSQVLNNFVSNAIKFTRDGEVELRADLLKHQDGNDLVRFSVKDTGIGITEEVQKRLFQRYAQESADTARMYGGTGLGLSICQRLAEMMDGKIELKSEPGQGSTFSLILSLPISNVPGKIVKNIHLEVKQRDVQPLLTDSSRAPLVLAVDDHPINRDLLARQVRLLGLRAQTAENGVAALSLWREGECDLVITDCHMPEMDGYELAAEIRKIEASSQRPRTPIIAWTANALAEEAGRCQAAGMDELLVKPANLLELKKTLAKWLFLDQAAASPSHAADAEPIDFAVLDMVVADRASQQKILQDFLAHLSSDYTNLETSLQKNDFAHARDTAHRMSGSSKMVGATQIAQACAAAEQAAQNKDTAALHAAFASIPAAQRKLEACLAGKFPGANQ